MLQNLAKHAYTRRATTGLVFGSPLSTVYTSRRFYATSENENIIKLLNECAEKEDASTTRNGYKIRSFRSAAAAIEKLDFKVQHGDDLKSVRGVGPGIRSRINVVLGHEDEHLLRPPTPKESQEQFARRNAVNMLMTVPGLGQKSAEALYDDGCDTIEKLHLEKYKEKLAPRPRKSLKYVKYLGSLVPRENAERIVAFCKDFLPLDGHEVVIAGDYRRGASTLSEAIELLIIDESALDPIPIPPHPSTLKQPPSSGRPTRKKHPFSQDYILNEDKITSVLLNKIIRPLEDLGVVSDSITPGANVWRGWMRVPKKSGSWELRKERIERKERLDGDFHQVNVTCIPKQSRGTGLLALTGDEEYHLDCKRKAIQAGLYLDEWGVWEWEPDSQSISRFQTSSAPHKKSSLGALWGSETEADEGRWVQLETPDEEQVLNAIGGEYVPPEKRNFRFIVGKKKVKKDPVVVENP